MPTYFLDTKPAGRKWPPERQKPCRYFLGTEFREVGETIDLISIGIVREDSQEYLTKKGNQNE
jgi:hypothetical protein